MLLVVTHNWNYHKWGVSRGGCARYSQFLDAVLVLEAFAGLNFLLTMLEVLGQRCALGGLLTFFSQCRQKLARKMISQM